MSEGIVTFVIGFSVGGLLVMGVDVLLLKRTKRAMDKILADARHELDAAYADARDELAILYEPWRCIDCGGTAILPAESSATPSPQQETS